MQCEPSENCEYNSLRNFLFVFQINWIQITFSNEPREHKMPPYPRIKVGCWVPALKINSICCISIDSKYHLHSHNSSSNASNWFVTNWPISQKLNRIVNDQMVWNIGLVTSTKDEFSLDCSKKHVAEKRNNYKIECIVIVWNIRSLAGLLN